MHKPWGRNEFSDFKKQKEGNDWSMQILQSWGEMATSSQLLMKCLLETPKRCIYIYSYSLYKYLYLISFNNTVRQALLFLFLGLRDQVCIARKWQHEAECQGLFTPLFPPHLNCRPMGLKQGTRNDTSAKPLTSQAGLRRIPIKKFCDGFVGILATVTIIKQ